MDRRSTGLNKCPARGDAPGRPRPLAHFSRSRAAGPFGACPAGALGAATDHHATVAQRVALRARPCPQMYFQGRITADDAQLAADRDLAQRPLYQQVTAAIQT